MAFRFELYHIGSPVESGHVLGRGYRIWCHVIGIHARVQPKDKMKNQLYMVIYLRKSQTYLFDGYEEYCDGSEFSLA